MPIPPFKEGNLSTDTTTKMVRGMVCRKVGMTIPPFKEGKLSTDGATKMVS